MKIAFPHMGHTYIALAGALRTLGAELVIPPYNTKRTLSLGSRHSPEVVCLPYKLILGNYLEAIEAGADALLMIESPGTCRLGEYAPSCMNAIKDLGYDVKFINIDLYKHGAYKLCQGLAEASGNQNPLALLRAMHITLTKIDMLDRLDDAYSFCRAREIRFGTAKKAHKKALKLLDEANSIVECKTALKKGLEMLDKVPVNRFKEVLNIDITGEIYVVLDHFSNMEVEDELGRMGVHVHRKIRLSNWTNRFIKPFMFNYNENHEEKMKKLAGEYLRRDVGGDAIESVGDTVAASDCGSDGIIHLLPFTCMPEIISQNILHKVAKERNIPVLSLILDEFTGKAGFVTRLEAFIDLSARKKAQKTSAMACIN
jgi:predicted nucleotide-binding protein (sugar kinase/HSP70/actin superfamily)